MPDHRRANRFPAPNSIYAVPGLISLVCVAFLLTGCDGRPSRVKVSGHITCDGKPVEFGGVSFKPVAGGRVGGGGIESGGAYTVTMYEKGDGIPLGKYTVTISSAETLNPRTIRWHAPEKYSNPKTSGLSVEITEATSELDFELTWDGDEHSEPWIQKF